MRGPVPQGENQTVSFFGGGGGLARSLVFGCVQVETHLLEAEHYKLFTKKDGRG